MSPQAGGPTAKPAFTVAEVLRVGLPEYAREQPMPPQHWRVLRAIMACRTPALGGHLYQCAGCGERQFVPHSCRNRHCPTCQGANGYAWLEAQKDVLLPIPYFHVVFTLPHALNPLIRQNPARCYELLFAAASATLLSFGEHELQAQLGLTMVLHTWSQTLLEHYHVHAIVTGGGLRTAGTGWVSTPAHWLFPVKALSAMFRGKFCAGLQALYQAGRLEFHGQIARLASRPAFQRLLGDAANKPWVVYAKHPFAGPETVLAYLARYTHRIGLTNYRLRDLDPVAHTVTFAYKDYADRSWSKSPATRLRRVHPAAAPPHPAATLREDPPLRVAGQSQPSYAHRRRSRRVAAGADYPPSAGDPARVGAPTRTAERAASVLPALPRRSRLAPRGDGAAVASTRSSLRAVPRLLVSFPLERRSVPCALGANAPSTGPSVATVSVTALAPLSPYARLLISPTIPSNSARLMVVCTRPATARIRLPLPARYFPLILFSTR